MRTLLFLLILYPTILVAQQEQKADLWKPLRFFEGTWEGTANGEPGSGAVKREYRFILRGKFLEARSTVTYSAQGKNTKGEVHEEFGLYGYDRSRKKFVLRQFHVEGFVNQYVLDSISTTGTTVVFLTESIENIPPGWKARETYHITGSDEFTETFELAEPGKGFSQYSQSHLKRVRNNH